MAKTVDDDVVDRKEVMHMKKKLEATPMRRIFCRYIRLKTGRVLDARAYGKDAWSFLVPDLAANDDTEEPTAATVANTDVEN